MTGTRARTHRRRRAHAMVLGIVVAIGLTACAPGDPSGQATVTVWVDPPTETDDPGPAEPAQDTPTTASESPTELSAGHLRGAVTSYQQARAHFDAASRTVAVRAFRSPSGNIFCRIDTNTAACEVRAGRVAPPVDGVCTDDGPRDVGRLELGASGARPVCNDDSIRDGGAPRLAYGRRTEVAGARITCLSEEMGVTCVDPQSEHGFWIARDSFATF